MRQSSNDQVEEPANILNDLALNSGETPTPVSISAPKERRYPTRGRKNMGQDPEALKSSASIAGKLKRPTNRRAGGGTGTSKETRATESPSLEQEVHTSATTAEASNTGSKSSRGTEEAKISASVHLKESELYDIVNQEAELSIQDGSSDEENHISHQSSGFQEEHSDHVGYLELFGQERAWAEVLDGVQSVGVSNSGDESLPRLKSQIVKELVSNTKLAEQIFDKLLPEQDMNDANQDLQLQLEKILAGISEEVTNIDEPASEKEASVVKRDIYAHAIPTLVLMLSSALRCRTPDYGNLDDTEALRAIISIQDIVWRLCEKAGKWKAKPNSETPIVNSTRQKIRPNLRKLREVFQAELNRRERSAMHTARERKIAVAHERLFDKMIKEREDKERKRKEKATLIKEDLDRTKKLLGLRKSLPSQDRDGSEHENENPNNPSSSDQWTDDQNLELIVQLQNPDSRHLPGV